MTLRVVLVSSIMNHPLNRHVVRGIRTGFANLGPQVDCQAMTPAYAVEPGALDGAELLICVGSTKNSAWPIEHIAELARAAGCVTVFWATEDPYERDFTWRADGYEHYVSNDRTAASMLLSRPNVMHLPLAGNFEDDYRPLFDWDKRGLDIFFCGTPYQNRRIFVKDLLQARDSQNERLDMAVCGKNWAELDRHNLPHDITHARLQDFHSQARFVLYMHRTLDIANRRLGLVATTPGPRLFETALAGTVQLCAYFSHELERYFAPGSEVEMVFSGEDAFEHAHALSRDLGKWMGMARAAQLRATREHCYEHRLIDLLERVAQNRLDAADIAAMKETVADLTAERLDLVESRA